MLESINKIVFDVVMEKKRNPFAFPPQTKSTKKKLHIWQNTHFQPPLQFANLFNFFTNK